MPTTTANAIPDEPLAPAVINSCPACSHWLPDGTLVCPDCQTLTYRDHLSEIAASAQRLEQQQKWTAARDRWLKALAWLPADTRQAASIQEHVAALNQRLTAEEQRKANWTKRLGPLAPVALFLAKFKTAFFLLFKLKFLLSLLAYFSVYWAIFGWQFALGLTLTVLLHEMGHYIAAKWRGLPVEAPMFLPGFGAYVRWQSAGASLSDISLIALAGPVSGLIVALVAYALLLTTHMPFFLMMAYLSSWINLINLFPVAFPIIALDGAYAAYDMSRLQRGLIAVTCLVFFGLTLNAAGGDWSSPVVHYVFLVLGLGMLWRTFTGGEPEQAGSRTFAVFQVLIIALGALQLVTQSMSAQLAR